MTARSRWCWAGESRSGEGASRTPLPGRFEAQGIGLSEPAQGPIDELICRGRLVGDALAVKGPVEDPLRSAEAVLGQLLAPAFDQGRLADAARRHDADQALARILPGGVQKLQLFVAAQQEFPRHRKPRNGDLGAGLLGELGSRGGLQQVSDLLSQLGQVGIDLMLIAPGERTALERGLDAFEPADPLPGAGQDNERNHYQASFLAALQYRRYFLSQDELGSQKVGRNEQDGHRSALQRPLDLRLPILAGQDLAVIPNLEVPLGLQDGKMGDDLLLPGLVQVAVADKDSRLAHRFTHGNSSQGAWARSREGREGGEGGEGGEGVRNQESGIRKKGTGRLEDGILS